MTSDLKQATALLRKIALIGRSNPSHPTITSIEPLRAYIDMDTRSIADLDRRDGGVTRREALLRFLLVSAVVDQGPDLEGIRDLVSRVTNELYSSEIRFLHRPLDFFQSINVSVQQIDSLHDVVKALRAKAWAEKNRTTPGKYSLYMDGAKQTLSYAVSRWGVPLALAYLLAKTNLDKGNDASESVYRYLRSYPSTEIMTIALKDHRTFGLGKAIGDKAAHLFGKWAVYSYPLLFSKNDPAWGQWSFEVPFDSNAGRVLYRTGFLNRWASAKEYHEREVLQRRKGKGGTTYLRVTNIRGMKSSAVIQSAKLIKAYEDLCVTHLKTHKKRPRSIEIQRIASAISLLDRSFMPGEIDDGLIKVGTTWCLNTSSPNCKECPLLVLCEGASSKPQLISDVRT